MIAGISVTCFAASYAIAWVLEALRVANSTRARRAGALLFTVAGLTAHTLFLSQRAMGDSQSPMSSWYDWYLLAAWALAALHLYLAVARARQPVGLFILPCVLALVGVALVTASDAPFPRAESQRIWGWVHGLLLLAGSVAVLAGFVFGVMYLWQARRLKHNRLPRPGLRLPSLEWLERMNERMILASVFMLGLGFLAGIVSNLVNHTLVPWTDPVVWSSSILAAWMAAVAVFQAVYRPARVGRKVAYLTVFSFLFLLVTLGILKLTDTSHGSLKPSTAEARAAGSGAKGGGRP
jgi:ABC-type transport system involved in cytochrome c biogenesis permease subunit